MRTFNEAENVGIQLQSRGNTDATRWRRPVGCLCLLFGIGLTGAVGGLVLDSQANNLADERREQGDIATVTARLLENTHYAGRPFDDAVASQFLDHYLDLLDGARLHFLESDLKGFAPLRTRLDDLTLAGGDPSPAYEIFDRLRSRLEQRIAYVQDLLKTEEFEFAGTDTYTVEREHEPRPRDLAAARQLWRQHLRYEYLQEKLSDRKPEEIRQTLSRRYERLAHTLQQWNQDRIFSTYLTALANVYDPHSDYMGRRELEDFSISMTLSLVGIGATLQAEDGYCTIRELVAGGPAARSQRLRPGDRIVAVAQAGQEPVDVIDMPLSEAVALVRGKKGTSVQLTILPAAAADSSTRKIITLVRDEIKLEDQEAKARIVDLPGGGGHPVRVGMIDLPSFYSGVQGGRRGEAKSATADVAKLIHKLKQENIQGLILDLRRNGGGSLEEAVSLTGLFIQRGPVVQTKGADGAMDVEKDPDPTAPYIGPLIVLTSRLSASASEILAGALQDYGRALIVGDPASFGKGTVQSVLPLAPAMRQAGLPVDGDPGALKLTIRKFYRPDGASTQLRGVVSDLVLPSPTGKLRIGETEMTSPLAWDHVSPVRHANYDMVAPVLAVLKTNSQRRLATDQDFIWLGKDLERMQKQLDHPVVSLNEDQRRAEKAEVEILSAQRKQDLASHPRPPYKQYAITLRNAGTTGLTEAMVVPPQPRAAMASGKASSEISDDFEPETDSARDVVLEETERILVDYVMLSSAERPTITAARKGTISR